MQLKILIMGLPGSGKTTLAKYLADILDAVMWDADDVRKHINHHLGFTVEDRLQQAKTMGYLSDRVSRDGAVVIACFVCPTPEAREAYGTFGAPDVTVWMNTIKAGRFEDTNRVFVPPEKPDVIIDYFDIIPEQRDSQKPDLKTLERAVNEIAAVLEKKNANRNGDNRPA
jgi:adenylylsulfate kinase